MEPPTNAAAPEPAAAPQEQPAPLVAPAAAVAAPAELHPKRSKKEDRQHKKDDKAGESFLKLLSGIQNPEEKVTLLTKKYAEVADENKRLHTFIKHSDKRHAIITKEKEQLQSEYNRTVLVKSKLENLCRELQKQNKCIKDESMLKIREEEERRKETQAKFQSTLTEITALLQQNNEKNSKLRDDNISMTEKFKGVVEQYQLREQQVEKMAKQMSLEQQLSEAKLAKASLQAQAERERLMADIAKHKLELSQCHAHMLESRGTEASLRQQIDVYTDKYDQFQNALVKSNQVFGGFKGEMEKMSKKIVKLEKESLSWKNRWEGSQKALLEMATDKRLRDEQSAAADKKVAQLQRLCRTMQSERTILLTTLKDNNIERPPVPLPPPQPAPPAQPPTPSKADAMAANCAQLKQSLGQLQNQLNALTKKTDEENQTKIAAVKVEEENQTKINQPTTTKTKKGRGKKSKAKVLQESTEASSSDPPTDASNENKVPTAENKVVNESTVTMKNVMDPEYSEQLDGHLKLDSDIFTINETNEDDIINDVITDIKLEAPVVEIECNVEKITQNGNEIADETVLSNDSDATLNGTAKTEILNGEANGEVINETTVIVAKPTESQEVTDVALKADVVNTDMKATVSDPQTTNEVKS